MSEHLLQKLQEQILNTERDKYRVDFEEISKIFQIFVKDRTHYHYNQIVKFFHFTSVF